MSVRNRRWRCPTRKIVLVSTLTILILFYWWTRPDPSYVVPPFEVGGKLKVVVVDENEERIADALVTPNGLRAIQAPGSWYSWQEHEHGRITPSTTNEDGLAEVTYPKWVNRTTGLLTAVVPIVVEHPEFCSQDGSECQVPQAGTVTPITRVHLHRGGRLRIKAYRPESTEPLGEFQWYDSSNWHRGKAGWKQEDGSRLTQTFPVGTHVLRVVDNAEPELLYFSDPITLNAVAGQIEDLQVHLRPAISVRGKLDCPAPVKDGYVIAHVIDSVVDAITGKSQIARWETWTHVDESGEFEFRSLPPAASISLLAWCDGYYSQQPDLQTIPAQMIAMKDIRSLPQFFSMREEPYFCLVRMAICSKCEVTVTDSLGLPIDEVNVGFAPNVTYDGRGSWMFGAATRYENIRPMESMSHLNRQLAWEKRRNDRSETLSPKFGGRTDADGLIQINNLVGRGPQRLWIDHERFVVRGSSQPPFNSDVSVEIQPGSSSKVTVVMVPKPKLTAGMLAPIPKTNPSGIVQQVVDHIKRIFE